MKILKLIVLFALAIGIIDQHQVNARGIDGKLLAVRTNGTCEQHSYFMENEGDLLKFNWKYLLFKYNNSVKISTLDNFSIIDRKCRNGSFIVRKKILGKKSQIRTYEEKPVTGHYFCFRFERNQNKLTLCPPNEDFLKLYKNITRSLLNNMSRFNRISSTNIANARASRKMSREDILNHMELWKFFSRYPIFSAVHLRSDEDHESITTTRDRPLQDERDKSHSFSIDKKIGGGGGGKVFKGERIEGIITQAQLRANEYTGLGKCAIKVLEEELSDNNKDVAASFVKEARIMYSLDRHKNVIKFYGVNAYRDSPYLYMARADADLFELQVERKYLTEEQKDDPEATANVQDTPKYSDPEILYDIALQFLKGIGHMHKNGYYHFDIKPQNVMIKEKEIGSGEDKKIVPVVKVIDFGLTRTKALFTFEEFFEFNPVMKGTPIYNTPERVTLDMESCDSIRCLELQDSYAAGLTILDALIAPQGPNISRLFNGSTKVKLTNKELLPAFRSHYHDKFKPSPFKRAMAEKQLGRLYQIALEMTALKPSERITIREAYKKVLSAKRRIKPNG